MEDSRSPPRDTEAEGGRSPDPEDELTVVIEGDGAPPLESPKPAAT